MPYTRDLRHTTQEHVQLAGGKAAALGELMAAGVPVPPGFVVTTHAFADLLRALPQPTAEAIIAAPLPADLEQEILTAYENLGAPFVAVRSSATAEDGATHAWAGQLESFVPTARADLLANIKKCWASLYSPRAIAYRKQAGLTDAEVSVAVIVQTLVESEHAGIAFSAHPVTGSRDHMIVEAVHGLGEAAVGGHVTPHTYVLGKQSGDIIEMYEGTQENMLVRGDLGQAEWRPLPPDARRLSPTDLTLLARHIKTIEDHFGQPMDIEWAQAHNTFYIVQSRPITTL